MLQNAPLASFSILIPVLNEEKTLQARLETLAAMRARGAEVIVMDGGDAQAFARTKAIAEPLADVVLHSRRGRARQMNAGAAAASGDILLFLHADTGLPEDALTILGAALAQSSRQWGRFDVDIAGRHPLLPVVSAAMNFRSRLTGIATGDQAIFVRRNAFDAIGGFPDIALMEDIALSGRLKRLSRPVCLGARVTTSGRRWDSHGFWRTISLMWRLRLAYFCGADPDSLARAYGYHPHGP